MVCLLVAFESDAGKQGAVCILFVYLFDSVEQFVQGLPFTTRADKQKVTRNLIRLTRSYLLSFCLILANHNIIQIMHIPAHVPLPNDSGAGGDPDTARQLRMKKVSILPHSRGEFHLVNFGPRHLELEVLSAM